MIKAAINGIRTNADHPRLPFDGELAAQESARCIEVGAKAIHVHVWNIHGQESLEPVDVASFLSAIRLACPNIPVGISTGSWIVPDLGKRLHLIEAWEIQPDFVSLNTDEPGWMEVAEVLLHKGIGIEAGICNKIAAESLASWPKRDHCLRVLLEPNEATIEAAQANVEAIEEILDRAVPNLPRLLHGLDETTWPMVKFAAERGYDTRIGFEDSIFLPNGERAEYNDELVREAIKIMS